MCRVRFGLTGVYFDSLEPSRPREDFFQPLIVAIPPVAQNKQADTVPKTIDSESEGKQVTATRIPKNNEDGIIINPSDSSSSPSSSSSIFRDEQGRRLAGKKKTNHATVGSKRVRNSSVSSSSSTSSPPSSDEDQDHLSSNTKTNLQAAKPVRSHTTQKYNNKPSKTHVSTSLRVLTKHPPAKRVRFAMDVQEKTIPSDDVSETSSSHSSNDSYTDPPSPTEPYDAFAGYYRAPGASGSRRMNGRVVGSRMQFPAEEYMDTDDADGFPGSEDGSEVDIQGLPIKGRPPRTAQAGRQSLNQRNHQNSSTPLARSKHSGKKESRVTAGGLESNVDGGLHSEQSHASQKESVSPLRSGGHLRYPRLRSGKVLPEPIFVVRPRFLSDTKEIGKPAHILSSSGYSRGFSKNEHEGTKAPPPRLARVNAAKKNKTPKYHIPSVSEDLAEDAEFDKDLGLLVRDV